MAENILYYGDNLEVLPLHVKDESVDLIYLDPPFNSNKDYNVLFEEQDGTRAAAQIKAFGDTWRWDQGAARSYAETVTKGGPVARAMEAFRGHLGDTDMLAYLSMMAPRLLQLHRVMRPAASIYLHCDPTASHYLKMLMDAVFGPKQFRNEIIWHYSGWNKILASAFESRHDVILFYAKGKNAFNGYSVPWESKEEYVKLRKQKVRLDENGEEYVLSDAGGGKRIKRYLKDAMTAGSPVDDVWDIDKLNNSSKEKLGYPTQKPLALLERIVQASSKPGDVVLDPFCGCGTTIDAAQRLGRNWIGIDITHLAINLIRHRLTSAYGPSIIKSFAVKGEPVSLSGAIELAATDKYQFQWWALGKVGARPSDEKKGADQGIDGRLPFEDEDVSKGARMKYVILSVKGGEKIPANAVRDLRGVIEREKAAIGVLISMAPPTKAMRAEAASAGFYASPWGTTHARIQLLTIEEILNGKGIDYPAPTQTTRALKAAPKATAPEPENLSLLAEQDGPVPTPASPPNTRKGKK